MRQEPFFETVIIAGPQEARPQKIHPSSERSTDFWLVSRLCGGSADGPLLRQVERGKGRARSLIGLMLCGERWLRGISRAL